MTSNSELVVDSMTKTAKNNRDNTLKFITELTSNYVPILYRDIVATRVANIADMNHTLGMQFICDFILSTTEFYKDELDKIKNKGGVSDMYISVTYINYIEMLENLHKSCLNLMQYFEDNLVKLKTEQNK